MVADCRSFLPRQTVINAYRYILGRHPESDTHVATWMACGCVNKLIEGFLAGPEFHSLSPERQRLAVEWIQAGMITSADQRDADHRPHLLHHPATSAAISAHASSATAH